MCPACWAAMPLRHGCLVESYTTIQPMLWDGAGVDAPVRRDPGAARRAGDLRPGLDLRHHAARCAADVGPGRRAPGRYRGSPGLAACCRPRYAISPQGHRLLRSGHPGGAGRALPRMPATSTRRRAAPSATADAPIESIAVLPFVDMSPPGTRNSSADGMTEELLNRLAQVPDLHVAARTSSFAFKGRRTTSARSAGGWA
jgi:hypothetical protein